MITLSSSLLAHQKGPDRLPYLSVVATNKRADTHLLKWTRWYTGSETDSPHASCVANDGSLIRARNDAGNLQISRVATPTSGATYSSWTLLVAGLVAASGVALAAQPGEVTVLYTRGTTLFTRTSADNGATWAAEVARLAVGVTVGAVALAFNLSTTNACAFYTTAGTTVSRLRRTAGVWAGAGTAWTLTAASVTGLSACHNGGDFALLVSGTEVTTTHKRVWVTLMGDTNLPANVWATLVNVAESDTASTTTFAGPFIVAIGADVHGAYSHKEAGAVIYNRAFYSRPAHLDATNGTWSEPAPHEAATSFGLALAYLATGAANTVYATTPAGVWAATINQTTDLSPRVLAAEVEFGPEKGRARILCDNADGLLLTAPGGLATGGQLQLIPGYLSGPGATFESGVIWNFTVDAIEHRAARGVRTATIIASSPWEQLARWHAPQAWQSASGALSRDRLVMRLAGRAGFPLSTGGGVQAPSADWSATSPSFALPQDEDAATSLRRLLALVNDALRPDASQLEITGLTAGGPAVYSYGAPGEHLVTEVNLIEAPPTENWVRVQGPNRYADAVDLASVYAHGPRRDWRRFLDATSDSRATNAATNNLRRAQWAQPRGALQAAFNAGLQLFDLVALTAPNVGLTTPTTYRVIGHRLKFSRGLTPAYDHEITLGGP